MRRYGQNQGNNYKLEAKAVFRAIYSQFELVIRLFLPAMNLAG